jgi:predicted SnoaL-like aldol condensation-catalyzing enzyme
VGRRGRRPIRQNRQEAGLYLECRRIALEVFALGYIAEGNFVLCLVEARTKPPTANYDLFRVENGKIAEHWDVLSVVPPENRRKNINGPF